MYIYVQAQNGKPLMPTIRAGKVRRMLTDGRAVIVSHTPFTIRLTYETTAFTQLITLGVDAGAKHVGLSATTNQKELLAAQVDLRTDIVDNLSTRREARRTRRSKRSIRYRAPRFNNRNASKKPGWLAPSVEQKIHSHIKTIDLVCSILPVAEIVVEVAQFDTQLLKHPEIEGEQYQQGQQLSFWNVREYVLFRDGHQCQYCHGKSKDSILNVHHIESRKTGGNSPDNLITLCETCHKAYHKGKFELKAKRTSQSLRDAAFMSIMRWTVYDRLKAAHADKNVRMTYGYITKHVRIQNGLEKSHAVDARCISGHPAARPVDSECHFKLLRRHNRKVMKSNLLKCGQWKRNQAPREIKGFRLFDVVNYKGTSAYVHGRRSTGYFVVKDFEGHTLSNSVSYKSLRLKRHTNSYLFNIKKRQGP
ncbi:MAG: HNH endonuclease, partial [Paludibacteraceae bacterium]|nr:HNH endonuclease [Paludibacteraceae bacterium]